MKSFFENLLLFLCVSSLTLFIWAFTLQNTLLNRGVVKGWFHDSNVYAMLPQQLLTAQPSAEAEATGLLTPAGVADTLQKTFTPDYTEKQVTVIIDSFYDWLEGKRPNVDFALDLSDKKSDFSTNLARTLEPQIAALPACSKPAGFDAQNPTCIPPGYTAAELAQRVANETTSHIDLFKQPLTPQTLGTTTPMGSIGSVIAINALLVILLPIVSLITAAIYLFMQSNKLGALQRLSLRVVFSVGFLSLIGLALVVLGMNSGLLGGASDNVVMPLVSLFMSGIGGYLLMTSGVMTLIAGVTWLSISLYQRKHNVPSHPPSNMAK